MTYLMKQNILLKIFTALAIAFACGLFLLYAIGIYYIGPYAWDDGAITLAFSRTLTESGIFALTRHSEIVEGSSSLLLVFLAALLHWIFRFDFYQFILASQVLAFIFLCLTLILLYHYFRNIFPSASARLFLVCLFGALPMFASEIFNGMEMCMMAFLATAFLISFQNRANWVFALIPLLILTRFEAIFYLMFSLGLLWMFDKNDKKHIFIIAAYAMGTFMLFSLLRWLYFGDLLPNTIWAKMYPPYSLQGSLSERLHSKWEGAQEFWDVERWLILAAVTSLFLRKKGIRKMDMGVFLAASFAAFAAITGRNWGYSGRMYLASLPVFLFIIANSLHHCTIPGKGMSIRGFSVFMTSRMALYALLVSSLLGIHGANRELFIFNTKLALAGGFYQGRLPGYLDDMARNRLQAEKARLAFWYGISPENYKITGVAIERLRRILNLEAISFMTPDVGGLALCCGNIRVIDSALLTNTFLARHGYGAFAAYLERTGPDVIETHDPWSNVSGIYDSAFFQKNYLLMVFENNVLWIRRDHVGAILASSAIEKKRIGKVEEIKPLRYAGLDIDRRYRDKADYGEIWSVSVK
jgi:hypothetical protein